MCRGYMCMMMGEWRWSINNNKLAYNNNKIVDKKFLNEAYELGKSIV